MENKKLGQEPAFANAETYNPNNMECNGTYQIGMSKRFYAACAAMQGILANSYLTQSISRKVENTNDAMFLIVQQSYKYADELLKQENV